MSQAAKPCTPAEWPGAAVLGIWFIYLLVAPAWGFFWIDAWHNEQRAVQVLLLGATVVLAGISTRLRQALCPQSSTGVLLWAVAALGALSSLRSEHVWDALAEVSLYMLVLVLAVVTATAVRARPDRAARWARRASVLLGALHVVGVGARYVAMIALERAPSVDVLLLGYANPRFPSALYALLMPMIAMFALDSGERVTLRRLAWAILALLWCVNVALGTRAIWFAYAMALPLIVWIARWQRVAPAVRVLAMTAAAGLLVYAVLFIAVPRWLALGDALPSHVAHLVSVNDRAFLWQQSLSAITTHPWLGIGPMNLAGQGDSFASHPHDWVLQVAAEWGLPVVALLMWILWRIGRETRQSMLATHAKTFNVLGPLAAAVIGLCYGLVDGNLVMPVSQTAFAVLLGTAMGSTPVVAQFERKRPLVPWTLAPVIAGTALLSWYVVDTLPRQSDIEAAWRQTSRYPDLAPRFWQQGLLPR